jgi:hypothetical protein
MEALNAIQPVFLIIAIGYAAVRSGYIADETLKPVGVVVLRIALPALIFLAVASAPQRQGLQASVVIAIGLGSLAAFAPGLFVARVLLRLPMSAAAMAGLGVSAANSGFLGYPILQTLSGTGEP